MNLFIRIFTAELLKVKNTFAIVLLFIVASSIPVYVAAEYLNHSHKIIVGPGINPWNFGWKRTITGVSIFAGPCIIIMISSLLMNTEHKNHGWKYLLTLPVLPGFIYSSKLLVNLLLIVFFYLVTFIVFLLCVLLIGIFMPESKFLEIAPDYQNILTLLVRSFIASLAIFAIHFWLSIRVKNMFISMVSGLMLIFFAMATYQLLKNTWYFPYNYGELTVFKKHSGDFFFARHEIASLILFTAVLFFGYLDFIRNFRG